jgi:hypothetical protein
MEKRRVLPNKLGERTRADVAPALANVRYPADQNKVAVSADRSDQLTQNGFDLYCGDAQRIGEGFAIALRAMGIEADFSPDEVALVPVRQTTEDK